MQDLLYFCNWCSILGKTTERKRGFVDFKMAIGIIIMVSDFIYGFAAMEFEKSGSSSMIWLVLIFISYH
jgi:dipeptide/tripeptide permease